MRIAYLILCHTDPDHIKRLTILPRSGFLQAERLPNGSRFFYLPFPSPTHFLQKNYKEMSNHRKLAGAGVKT